MLIEALRPLLVRLPDGDVQLEPGVPVELPDEHGQQLLRKAPDAVRRLSGPSQPVIEPAASNAKPIYWEHAEGRILGPAVPEFLAQVGEQFWVVVQYDGVPRWIRADRLRSKHAFEQQVKPIPFERIKKVR